MQEIGVGILGFGTVGAGVVEAIHRHQALIACRTGVRLVVKGVADLDLDSDRGVAVDRGLLTTDARAVIDHPEVRIVVETIGGLTAADTLIRHALKAGKAVVTANKALLAEHGRDLCQLADQCGVDLMFEASVGGGIPVLRALRDGLVANHIQGIYAILNGTCNFILTRMEEEGIPFEQALGEAQEKGFAEADPTLDIHGVDTAHKASILASLAYGYPVAMQDIFVRGIQDIETLDIVYAKELGYRIKLLATTAYHEGCVEISVCPTLVPHSHLLAAVHGEFNAVMIAGDVVGDTLYYGRGAGRRPTASAVLSDVTDAAVNLVRGCAHRLPSLVRHELYGPLRHQDEVRARYYMRMPLLNSPGVFARVAEILGRHGISIASLIQKESAIGEFVPVVFLTQEAPEANFTLALQEIDHLDVVGAPAVRYRVAHFEG